MRGRPTAAATHMDKEFSDMIKRNLADKTTRTQAAAFYKSAAFSLLSEAASEIPYLDGIFKIYGTGCNAGVKQKDEIIEQLGRMREQDGFPDNEIKAIAAVAAQAYHEGYTVKQIKAYILHGRQTGEWTPKDDMHWGYWLGEIGSRFL